MENMTPNQPYLLKAFYDWIVDNGLTPYIVVDAFITGVEVPQQFVKDGQIVLNVSPSACVNFSIELDAISFQARFSGQPMLVYVPCIAVSAIYARENGAGTVFTRSDEELQAFEAQFTGSSPESDISASQKNKLASVADGTPASDAAKDKSKISADTDNAAKKNKATRPSLKVVK
ncbi:ClpXP protease specificity-enhancing factor [Glaciecola sp. MH2013]|uniref:ClpXP protease specificity-enhancing factor n=1 Tax=Glaciecola sp. MH2013 TaxID=2785524 RepID=UPI00189D0E51|nr:ClpXP protease specificity-enhancing factor [Glaciecola sp. MH2013]MBF7075051.1 ClpXP protease specificity-enhancing factor [Glaciecola sp. MH2013]